MGPYDHLPDAHRENLDQSLDLLQKRLGCRAPEEPSIDVEPMRLTIDPIQIMGRPLMFYIAIKVINLTLLKYYEMKWDARLGRTDDLE